MLVQMGCTPPLYLLSRLSRVTLRGGGERLASCGAMYGLYCEIVSLNRIVRIVITSKTQNAISACCTYGEMMVC